VGSIPTRRTVGHSTLIQAVRSPPGPSNGAFLYISNMIYDTRILSGGAYDLFGNVAYVDHWFGAECFKPVMRVANMPGRSVKINGSPKWWKLPYRVDGFKSPPLSMNEALTDALVKKNGRYQKIYPPTVLDLERIARKHPGNDWQIELIQPNFWLTYQRQGRKKWVLIAVE
jgi:hypothetical protein